MKSVKTTEKADPEVIRTYTVTESIDEEIKRRAWKRQFETGQKVYESDIAVEALKIGLGL